MKNLFVSYQLALALKEKGFDEDCLGGYSITDEHQFEFLFRISQIPIRKNSQMLYVLAPTHQQVTDWLREKHDLHIEVNGIGSLWCFSFYKIHRGQSTECIFESDDIVIDYYEAFNNSIKEALKRI